MSSFKKAGFALMALASTAVFSGTMGAVCPEGSVAVPCEKPTWQLGADALYLRPQVGRGVEKSPGSPTASVLDYTQPAWGWGFRLDGSYYYRVGNDINVNWSYFDNTIHNGSGATTTVDGNDDDKVFGTITSQLTTVWDEVNVELGQLVQFGAFNKLRLHGGLQYSYFKLTGSSDAVFPNSSVANLTTYNANSFSGFGPRAGVDLFSDLGRGVSVYLKGAGALLLGKDIEDSTGSGTFVVPELEGKIGGQWTHHITRSWLPGPTQGDLVLDAGYLWQTYINAYQGAFYSFNLNGVYFGAKWVGFV